MSKANKQILQAAKAAGGKSKLADAIGMSKQFLGQLCKGDRPVPAKWCIPIEHACHGVVTRHQLRPDVFGEKSAAA